MERSEILEKVNDVFKDVLEEDVSIKEDYSSGDVEGWDSLNHIILIIGIEKKFNIKFNSSEILNWKDVGEMISSIKSKV